MVYDNVLDCITRQHLVLQCITMYYKVPLGIARCDKACPSVVGDMGGGVTCVLHGIRMYQNVRFGTTTYYFVLRSTTWYYEVRRGTTKSDFVLGSTTLYYAVLLCTTKSYFVRRRLTLYYEVRLSITTYYNVPLGTTMYYDVLQGTTWYQKVRQGAIPCGLVTGRHVNGVR